MRKNMEDESITILFEELFKDDLWYELKGLEYVKYLRWNNDKSYLRFHIYNQTFKVIVSESYKPFEDLPVFIDDDWVINATKWYSNVEEIIDTVVDIINWLIDFFNYKERQKMADYAESNGMNPYNLGYQYVKKKHGFCISHSPEFNELVDELARQYIAHLKLQDNKFGALFQIMRVNASIIFDSLIDEKERAL